MTLGGIWLRAVSQKLSEISLTTECLKIPNLKIFLHLPGANGLIIDADPTFLPGAVL